MSNKKTLRWVIAHHPVELFKRTAELFKQELEKECPNQFDVEIHTLHTFGKKYNKPEFSLVQPDIKGLEVGKGKFVSCVDNKEYEETKIKSWNEMPKKWNSFFNSLKEGEFEISQTVVNIVGAFLNRDYNAIDLPFLFRNHDHVTEVLDGPIGNEMGENLAKTGVRGLAFTYSGGYRVIGAKKGITSLSDLSEMKLFTQTSHSNALFDNVGAKTIKKVDASPADVADLSEGDSGAVETTYLRFVGKNVLKTQHSMFTTTILTGEKFFNSLTLEQQEAFKRITKVVAKQERKWSLEDAAAYEDNAKANGVTINEINKSDLAKLQESAKKVYSNLKNIGMNQSLVNRIIETGSPKAVNA